MQYQSLLFSKFEQISANVVFATLLLYFGYPRKSIFSSSATYKRPALSWRDSSFGRGSAVQCNRMVIGSNPVH